MRTKSQEALARVVDHGLREAARRPQRRATPQPTVMPEAEPAEAMEPTASTPRTLCEPVMFVCNAVPALGMGLAGKMYFFQNGALTLDDPEAIEAIRAHPLFCRQIFEYIDMPADLPEELQETPESQSMLLPPGARPRGPRTIRLMPGRLGVSRKP